MYQVRSFNPNDIRESMNGQMRHELDQRIRKTATEMQPEVRKQLAAILQNPNTVRSEMNHGDNPTQPSDPVQPSALQTPDAQAPGSQAPGSQAPDAQAPGPDHGVNDASESSAQINRYPTDPVPDNVESQDNVRLQDSSISQDQSNPGSVTDDNPQPGKVKLVIYHMEGCGHCEDMVGKKLGNGKTVVENLKHIFENDPQVAVLDFKHGRDPVVEKRGIMYFPTIKLVKGDGAYEYNGPRDVESLADFCMQHKE